MPAPVVVIQTFASATGTTSLAATFTQPVLAGDVVLLAVGWQGPSAADVDWGGTWPADLGGFSSLDTGLGAYHHVALRARALAAGEQTVTVTATGTWASGSATAVLLRGVSAVSTPVVDVTAVDTTGGSASTTTITDGDLVFAVVLNGMGRFTPWLRIGLALPDVRLFRGNPLQVAAGTTLTAADTGHNMVLVGALRAWGGTTSAPQSAFMWIID